MACTGVSNVSNTATQTGRHATMPLRYCRPEQKASSSTCTNCKLVQSCSLEQWLREELCRTRTGRPARDCWKARHSDRIFLHFSVLYNMLGKGNKMFQIKSLTQVDIIVKAAEMQKWDEYELNQLCKPKFFCFMSSKYYIKQ